MPSYVPGARLSRLAFDQETCECRQILKIGTLLCGARRGGDIVRPVHSEDSDRLQNRERHFGKVCRQEVTAKTDSLACAGCEA